jgi:hypothetical protein
MTRDLARCAVAAVAVLSIVPLHAQDVPPPCRQRQVNVEHANYAPKTDMAKGSLCVDASATTIRLEVRQAKIVAVLSALSTIYKISYRSSIMIDEARDGIYAGSIEGVIPRLLYGYDYVIKHENAALDVVVLDKKGGQPAIASDVTQVNQDPERTARVSRTR